MTLKLDPPSIHMAPVARVDRDNTASYDWLKYRALSSHAGTQYSEKNLYFVVLLLLILLIIFFFFFFYYFFLLLLLVVVVVVYNI